MDDPVLVRCGDGVDQLPGDCDDLGHGQWPASDPVREVLALDELHDQGARRPAFFEAVDMGDVRMVQRGERPGFALESGEPVRDSRQRVREHFHGDVPFQLRVPRPIHLAHTSRAYQGGDFVGAETRSERERHYRRSIARMPVLPKNSLVFRSTDMGSAALSARRRACVPLRTPVSARRSRTPALRGRDPRPSRASTRGGCRVTP